MTTTNHNGDMITVGLAELKAHLSDYVRAAQNSMADVERMLDAASYKPIIPDAAIDRAIHENKQDTARLTGHV